MKQYSLLFCGLFLAFLMSCSQPASNVVWVKPGEGGAVSGPVALRAQALQEPFPANVVFYAGTEPIAKAYEEDGIYNAVWNSQSTSGQIVLGAKPYGGRPVTRNVTVAEPTHE